MDRRAFILKRKDHGAILSELILVLERLERERG